MKGDLFELSRTRSTLSQFRVWSTAMAVPQEQSLDEIQWRSPRDVQEMGGIHTNTGRPIVPAG